MGKYKYVTNRTLDSKDGRPAAGRVKVFVLDGSDRLEGEYKCPECGHEGRVSQEFKRPINVECVGCGYKMKLPKLKGKK